MNAAPGATGRLVLVPNALDLGGPPQPIADVLPAGVMHRAAGLTHWVVENARSARAFLKRIEPAHALARPLQQLQIVELPRARKGSGADVPAAQYRALLAPAFEGQDIGLLSEAGLPALADPGAALVGAAHAAGIAVEPLPGASAIALALAASGLNGQRFAFEGYLPQEPESRLQRVRELESRSRAEGQTQIAIETPYRNPALATALIRALQPRTQLAIACGLTMPGGWCRAARVEAWRAQALEIPTTVPAVFLWLAG